MYISGFSLAPSAHVSSVWWRAACSCHFFKFWESQTSGEPNTVCRALFPVPHTGVEHAVWTTVFPQRITNPVQSKYEFPLLTHFACTYCGASLFSAPCGQSNRGTFLACPRQLGSYNGIQIQQGTLCFMHGVLTDANILKKKSEETKYELSWVNVSVYYLWLLCSKIVIKIDLHSGLQIATK